MVVGFWISCLFLTESGKLPTRVKGKPGKVYGILKP
jgi:hypothetical protein